MTEEKIKQSLEIYDIDLCFNIDDLEQKQQVIEMIEKLDKLENGD